MRRSQGRVGLLAAYTALLVVLAVPVLLVDVPVGVDTLAHLARLHVRAHIGTDPDLARLFTVRDGLIPYLGMDWLLTPLVGLLPTLVVGRIATVLSVWGIVGAVAVLQRSFTGRWGAEPLLAGVIAWNGMTAWGFLNYLMGMALALGTLALWHSWRGRPVWVRLLVFGAASAGLYLVHLLALVLYAGLVGLYAITTRDWRARTWLVMALQSVPVVVLWLVYAPPLPQGSLGVLYNLPAALIAFASPTLFPAALGGWESGHIVFVVTVFGLCGLTLARIVIWDRTLLSMAGVLFLVGLAIPVAAVGISWVNLRLPLVAACFAVAAIRFSGSPAWGLVVAGLVLMRTASVTATMAACAPDYAELRQAMQALPRGVVLTPVLEREAPVRSCSWLPVYEHAGNLVTIERSGLSTDFFGRTTSVISRAATTDQIAAEMEIAGSVPLRGHALWMHLGRSWPLPPDAAILVHGSFFDLLRIDPAPELPDPVR